MADTGLERVVKAWRKSQSGAANQEAAIGHAVSLLLVKRLHRISDPQGRRDMRAETIAAAATAIAQDGGRATGSYLARCVRVHQVVLLLSLKGQPAHTIRKLLPLIRRNPKDETWELRKPDESLALVEKLEGMKPNNVAHEVDKILGRVPKAPKAPKPRRASIAKVLQDVAALTVEQRRVLFATLRKEFTKSKPKVVETPATVPLPVETEVVKPAGKPSWRERLAG